MHETLKSIQASLEGLTAQLQVALTSDAPFSMAHNNWSLPGLSKIDLINYVSEILLLITAQDVEDLGEQEKLLENYISSLQMLRTQTIPNMASSPAAAVPVFLQTLDGLKRALTPILDPDAPSKTQKKISEQLRTIRAIEALLNGLEPRTATLEAMVQRIEHAHSAADQLPTDLASLAEARQQLAALLNGANKDCCTLEDIKGRSHKYDQALATSFDQAESVLARCERAYSAATSVGLAAAFADRSKKLSWSMWVWVLGLILSLAAGGYFGSSRLHELSSLVLKPEVSSPAITLNILLALLSVGAPVWFAWLSTKQIGQRFRLAEDYAFKASISSAYEGFRREAAQFDKDMETRLLSSALSRFDELPLRLVETTTPGSPWHELLTSDLIKDALKVAPNFSEQVKNLAAKALAGTGKKRSAPSSPPNKNLARTNPLDIELAPQSSLRCGANYLGTSTPAYRTWPARPWRFRGSRPSCRGQSGSWCVCTGQAQPGVWFPARCGPSSRRSTT